MSPAPLSASLHSSAELIMVTLPSGVADPSSPAAWHTPLLRRAELSPRAPSSEALRCNRTARAGAALLATATCRADARGVWVGGAAAARTERERTLMVMQLMLVWHCLREDCEC